MGASEDIALVIFPFTRRQKKPRKRWKQNIATIGTVSIA